MKGDGGDVVEDETEDKKVCSLAKKKEKVVFWYSDGSWYHQLVYNNMFLWIHLVLIVVV